MCNVMGSNFRCSVISAKTLFECMSIGMSVCLSVCMYIELREAEAHRIDDTTNHVCILSVCLFRNNPRIVTSCLCEFDVKSDTKCATYRTPRPYWAITVECPNINLLGTYEVNM
jgi:hypothetical protein